MSKKQAKRQSKSNAKNQRSYIAIWTEKLTSFWTLAKLLVFILIIPAIFWTVADEFFTEKIILDPISHPDELTQLGYNPKIVSEKLSDAANKVTRENKNKAGILKDIMEMPIKINIDAPSELDFEIPQSNLTLRPLVRYLKTKFGQPPAHIEGEITKNENGFILTLRDLNNSVPVLQSTAYQNIEQLIEQNGKELLLKLAKPSVLVYQNYIQIAEASNHQVKKSKIFADFEALIDYCLKYPPVEDNVLAYKYKGYAYRELGMYQEAREEFKKIQMVNETRKGNFINRSLALIPYYSNQFNKEEIEAYHGFGVIAADMNQFDEAISYFQKIIKLDPNDEGAFYNLAMTLTKNNDLDGALEKIKRAVNINKENPDNYIAWGNILRTKGDKSGATAQFKTALLKDPQSSDAYLWWGFTLQLFNTDQPQEAIEKYQKAVELNDKNSTAYIQWGMALQRIGKTKEAIDKYQQAININPNNALLFRLTAFAQLDNGEFANGIKSLQSAVKLNPSDDDSYSRWGFELQKNNDKKGAIEKYRHALTLNPNNKLATLGVASLQN